MVTHSYDPANGNRTSTTDPNGNVTQFFYDDATKALPTRVVVDPLNGYGPFTTSNVYDYWTGVLTSQSDWNGPLTTTDRYQPTAPDPYMRPGVVSGEGGHFGGRWSELSQSAAQGQDDL